MTPVVFTRFQNASLQLSYHTDTDVHLLQLQTYCCKDKHYRYQTAQTEIVFVTYYISTMLKSV